MQPGAVTSVTQQTASLPQGATVDSASWHGALGQAQGEPEAAVQSAGAALQAAKRQPVSSAPAVPKEGAAEARRARAETKQNHHPASFKLAASLSPGTKPDEKTPPITTPQPLATAALAAAVPPPGIGQLTTPPARDLAAVNASTNAQATPGVAVNAQALAPAAAKQPPLQGAPPTGQAAPAPAPGPAAFPPPDQSGPVLPSHAARPPAGGTALAAPGPAAAGALLVSAAGPAAANNPVQRANLAAGRLAPPGFTVAAHGISASPVPSVRVPSSPPSAAKASVTARGQVPGSSAAVSAPVPPAAGPVPPSTAALAMPTTFAPAPHTGLASPAIPPGPIGSHGTQPNAVGLAAAVTAMHQTGQNSAVLRLDPPGLGHLAVHLTFGQSGHVNVLFVPANASAAALLQADLSGLGAAFAQSGLTLGQAQVGGQFNQNAGQGGRDPRPAPIPPPVDRTEAETPPPTGLSAYA